MRHMITKRKFNRDHSARKALLMNLSKALIEREQIKTTLPKAKTLRGVVEKLITRAKVDTVANRRLVASELGNSGADAVKKLFGVLGPRYAKRPGGYTRVLKAGFRYGDAAPMAIIELVDRDVAAKGAQKSTDNRDQRSENTAAKKTTATAPKSAAPATKVRETKTAAPRAGGAKAATAARRRTVSG